MFNSAIKTLINFSITWLIAINYFNRSTALIPTLRLFCNCLVKKLECFMEWNIPSTHQSWASDSVWIIYVWGYGCFWNMHGFITQFQLSVLKDICRYKHIPSSRQDLFSFYFFSFMVHMPLQIVGIFFKITDDKHCP